MFSTLTSNNTIIFVDNSRTYKLNLTSDMLTDITKTVNITDRSHLYTSVDKTRAYTIFGYFHVVNGSIVYTKKDMSSYIWINKKLVRALIDNKHSLLSIDMNTRDHIGSSTSVPTEQIVNNDYKFTIYDEDSTDKRYVYKFHLQVDTENNIKSTKVNVYMNDKRFWTFDNVFYFKVLSEPYKGSNVCILNINTKIYRFDLMTHVLKDITDIYKYNTRTWAGCVIFNDIYASVNTSKELIINNYNTHITMDHYVFTNNGIMYVSENKYYLACILPYTTDPDDNTGMPFSIKSLEITGDKYLSPVTEMFMYNYETDKIMIPNVEYYKRHLFSDAKKYDDDDHIYTMRCYKINDVDYDVYYNTAFSFLYMNDGAIVLLSNTSKLIKTILVDVDMKSLDIKINLDKNPITNIKTLEF